MIGRLMVSLSLIRVAMLVGADPQGWYPHEGGLLKYRVNLRFGEEPLTAAGGFGSGASTLPAGWKFGRVSAVAVDSAGEVYVFHRGKEADPLIVFDSQGRYLRSWGRGMFGDPHGLRIDPQGYVWITDVGLHQVMKFDRKGELRLVLGKRSVPGADAGTFNKPTDIAFAPSGDFYVSDGYGNSRVVKFSRDGKYLFAWGRAGTGAGEFHTPHSVAVDSHGTVYVSDRENNRIQIFTPEGKYLRQWNHLGSTQNLFLTPDDHLWILTHRDRVEGGAYNTLGGRVMHVDLKTGKILGSFESPGHWLHVTPAGVIFVGSLTGNVFRWTPGWPE
ncbi:MAG TPA: peptidyl-alpha-hydroxyglycine alpha-amidating lyase family protein [Bryobacteraceae bacterium]|nr:peptidyl-alpha-hydroxyglycine alpha-amidating lyase family protein [Bryobacteraceae bacterium]